MSRRRSSSTRISSASRSSSWWRIATTRAPATSSSTSATATCSGSSTSPATTIPRGWRRSAACSTWRSPFRPPSSTPRSASSTRPAWTTSAPTAALRRACTSATPTASASSSTARNSGSSTASRCSINGFNARPQGGCRREGLAQLAPDHQAKSRPSLVDSAHLVVDQARRQRDLPDHVVGHVGGHLRGALGPRDPEPAGRRHPRAQQVELGLELRPPGDERDDHVEQRRVGEVGVDLGLVADLCKQTVLEAVRRADDHELIVLADAEL